MMDISPPFQECNICVFCFETVREIAQCTFNPIWEHENYNKNNNTTFSRTPAKHASAVLDVFGKAAILVL